MTIDSKPDVWRSMTEPISYLNEPFVYLETADRRLFLEPYGPRFPKAVGKVFCLEPIRGGEHTEVNISYVRMITPWIFDDKMGDYVRIKVCGELSCQGERYALAQILSSSDGMARKDGGTWILIALYDNLSRNNLPDGSKRALLIQSMLEFEYAFNDRMSQDERDILDVERQTFARQMGWTCMGTKELESQCQALVGRLPY